MKRIALDKIDTNLEKIIVNLTSAGQGSLPPLEFSALKLAQETLGLLRRERKPRKIF